MILRAVAVRRAGQWPKLEMRDEVAFDHDQRYRRRMRFTATGGADVLLDLAEAVQARDGDAYELAEGGFIRVRAVAEPLLEVTAKDADTLTVLAWHIGNRHLAAQFLPGRMRLLDDHVIAAMLTQLGGTVVRLNAPFDPESGAYHHG